MTTVTRTKITVPRRRIDLLTRARLTDPLDDLLDYKLLLIAAPAGYGKTSLLVDWVHQNDLPVCWYALDPLDCDFQRFAAHFIAAISQVFPAFGKESRATLRNMAQSELDIRRLITAIVNDAFENIKEHFAFVLDDFHAVDSVDEINDFVNRFVEEVDENCHLVIASRTLLSLPNLPLMVGRSLVKGLSYAELAFQAEEIQALLLQNYQQKISLTQAQELVRETEGWITGLLLSAQTMWQGMTDRVRVARASGVGLYDYLAQQVLDQQPEIVREFLLKTSLLEEFDADLCKAVLGNPPPGTSWADLIREILQSNLFVLPVDHRGTWLRYHHLFRDFLQAKMVDAHSDEVERILTRLAATFAAEGEWERAYDIYHRLGEKDALAQLVAAAGTPMLKNGQVQILKKWLGELPPGELDSNPALVSLQGTIEMLVGSVERGVSRLSQAEQALRGVDDLPQLVKTLTRRATGRRFLGNYQGALSDLDEVLSLVSGVESLRDIQAEAFRVRGLCLHDVGQLAGAVEYLEKALAAYSDLDETPNIALSSLDLGLIYMAAGRLADALAHYSLALSYWRQAGDTIRQANVLNNIGVLHHLTGHYYQAGSYLEEALKLSRKSLNARIEAYSLASLGDVYADLSAFDAAEEAYRQAREISIRIDNRFLLLYSYLAEANLSRLRGDLAQAAGCLAIAGDLLRQSDSAFQRGMYQLRSGQLALASGALQAATSNLEQALNEFNTGGQKTEAIYAMMAQAQAYYQLGNMAAATRYVQEAIAPVIDTESFHILVVAGRGYRNMLTAVASAPKLTRMIPQLLKQIDKFERESPLFLRQLRRYSAIISVEHPPKLAVQTLGVSQVSLDGEPVSSPEWVNQKTARELFFLLLAHPEGLSKEAIGFTLWPESASNQLKMQFKNALYRLRRALGADVIVFDENEGLYHFNRTLDCEYDVEMFKSSVSEGDSALDREQQVEAYRFAARLYRGNYLPDVNGAWVWPEREELWQTFLRVALSLAQFSFDDGNYQLSLNYLRSILLKDKCQEGAHRLAMQAYAAIGNRADLIRQYESCCNALSAELGVSPSPQTEILYRQLLRYDSP